MRGGSIAICGLGIAFLAVTLAVGAQGQSQPVPATPSFEVASIHPVATGHEGFTSIGDYGTATFTARNMTLAYLIAIAFDVDSDKITGKPDWLDSSEYDITAKAPGDAGLSREQMQPLLQHLLEDRFHLTTHRVKKDVSGYGLVVARGGPKLRESKPEAPYFAYILQDQLRGGNMELETFAGMLSSPTGRPVIDKTGIAGNYDVELKFAPDAAIDSSLPSLFTALEEQLGLKLEPQKVPVEMLVIDHVEKTPTEN